MHPDDLAREVATAGAAMGGDDVVLYVVDHDQVTLRSLDEGAGVDQLVEGDGAGRAFREERAVSDGDGLWLAVKDSAERIGVLWVGDPGESSAQDWEALASAAGELVVAKSNYGDAVTARRRSRPMSVEAEMRWSLLPPLSYTGPVLGVSGIILPPYEVAGDAFDYGLTGRTASVAVLDAMGHGMEAARIANLAVGSFRNSRRCGLGPSDALVAIDELVADQFGDARFVTALVAQIDIDTGVLTIANAGHPPPLRLRRGSPAELVECRPARPAGLGGVAPRTEQVGLEPGDALLFLTDGIVEARSPTGEPFGEPRLAAEAAELYEQPMPLAELVRRLASVVLDHQGGRAGDDATLLVVRWNGPLS